MNRDVQLWYRQCQVCAQAKGPPSRHQARLRKIVTGAPMDTVATDILSGLPVTDDSLRYILVLTDYFTRCRSLNVHAYDVPWFLCAIWIAQSTPYRSGKEFRI